MRGKIRTVPVSVTKRNVGGSLVPRWTSRSASWGMNVWRHSRFTPVPRGPAVIDQVGASARSVNPTNRAASTDVPHQWLIGRPGSRLHSKAPAADRTACTPHGTASTREVRLIALPIGLAQDCLELPMVLSSRGQKACVNRNRPSVTSAMTRSVNTNTRTRLREGTPTVAPVGGILMTSGPSVPAGGPLPEATLPRRAGRLNRSRATPCAAPLSPGRECSASSRPPRPPDQRHPVQGGLPRGLVDRAQGRLREHVPVLVAVKKVKALVLRVLPDGEALHRSHVLPVHEVPRHPGGREIGADDGVLDHAGAVDLRGRRCHRALSLPGRSGALIDRTRRPARSRWGR